MSVSYKTEHELRNNETSHSNSDSYSCQKCTKVYATMTKLRRHDWRCHREIECNKCGEIISSRQEMKSHRENAHGMRNKVYCRYFG